MLLIHLSIISKKETGIKCMVNVLGEWLNAKNHLKALLREGSNLGAGRSIHSKHLECIYKKRFRPSWTKEASLSDVCLIKLQTTSINFINTAPTPTWYIKICIQISYLNSSRLAPMLVVDIQGRCLRWLSASSLIFSTKWSNQQLSSGGN